MNAHGTLFIIAPQGETPQKPINRGTDKQAAMSIRWSTTQQHKGMNYRCTQWHRWVWNNYAEGKKPKRLHSVWFNLYEIIKNANSSIVTERRSVVFWGEQLEEIRKENKKTFWGDGYVYYLDCDDGFMSIYVYFIVSEHINIYSSSYVSYTSRKLLKMFSTKSTLKI